MNPKEKSAVSLLDDIIDALVRVKSGAETLEEAIQKAAQAREKIVLEAFDMDVLESQAPAPAHLSKRDAQRYYIIRNLASLYMSLIKDAGGTVDFLAQSKVLREASEALQSFEDQEEQGT